MEPVGIDIAAFLAFVREPLEKRRVKGRGRKTQRREESITVTNYQKFTIICREKKDE